MRKLISIIILGVIISGCSKKQYVHLIFLDEFVVKDSDMFQNSILGGFSGIDHFKDTYYIVIDDAKSPRFVTSNINIYKDKIQSIDFKNVVFLNDSTHNFYKENALDLESIFIDETNQEINFVSEWNINKNKAPSIFVTDSNANFKYNYELPSQFTDLNIIKHNAVFEASTKSADNEGFWIAMEGVLKTDGEEPNFKKQITPSRFTYFDKNTKKATKQYAYQLEHITRSAKGNMNLNGVTAILEYKKNHFFVVVRIYQNGYGAYGNTIQIFEAFVNEETTNTLGMNALKNNPFIPLQKRLLFNFDTIKDKLTEGIIDNIEGITFGSELTNANQSLILVSDDNFQIYGKQLNQFILLEIASK